MNMLSKSDNALTGGVFGGFPAMDELMRNFFGRFGGLAPEFFSGANFDSALEVEVGDKEVVAKLPCAGCRPEDFAVEIVGDFLTVNVKRNAGPGPESEDGKRYLCRERSTSEFEESIRLPVAVNGSAAKAKYQDGVLTLTIPREDEKKNSHVIKVK